MPRCSVHRGQQAHVGPPRDELLDQRHVRRVVLDIEQRAQPRAGRRWRFGRRPRTRRCSTTRRGAPQSKSSSNQNTLPTPTVLSTPIAPSISSTSRLLTTRPMPVPSSRRRFLSETVERLEQLRQLFRRQSRAGVADADANAFRVVRDARPRRPFPAAWLYLIALESRLMSDLLQPGPVGVDEGTGCRTGERSC